MLDNPTFRRLTRNTLSIYLSFIVRKCSALLLGIVIIRISSKADFGLYCLSLFLIELGIRLAVFGSNILIVRDISANLPGAGPLVRNTFAWRILASLLIYPVIVAIGFSIAQSSLLPWVLAVMGIGMVMEIIADLFFSVVQGIERVDMFALAEGTYNLVGLCIGLVALYLGFGIKGVAVAYCFRSLTALIWGMVICLGRKDDIKPLWNTGAIWELLKRSAPIGSTQLLTLVYLGSGMTALQYFSGVDAVGSFAASMKIFEGCTALGMLTMVAAFPTISRLRTTSTDELRKTAGFLIRFFCWAGIPLSLLVALNSQRVLFFLFGPELLNCWYPLFILMLAVPLSLNYGLIERLAYAASDQKRVLQVRLVSIIISIIILIALVRSCDYMAPAIAVLFAESAMFLMLLPKWSTYVPGLGYLRTAMPAAVLSLIAISPFAITGTLFDIRSSIMFTVIYCVMALAFVLSTRPTRKLVQPAGGPVK